MIATRAEPTRTERALQQTAATRMIMSAWSAPSARFGELPEGSTEVHPAWPLDPDEPYTVLLFDSEGAEIGQGEFTP